MSEPNEPNGVEVYSASTSFFSLAERFGPAPFRAPKPLRRFLSLGRLHSVKSILEAELPLDTESLREIAEYAEAGIVLERHRRLIVLSGARPEEVEKKLHPVPKCVGFCILHTDEFPHGERFGGVYVAESVISPNKSMDGDRYLLCQRTFRRNFGVVSCTLRGASSVQQSVHSGCCAHATIKVLLGTLGRAPMEYADMNGLVGVSPPPKNACKIGLTHHQVRRILATRDLDAVPRAFEIDQRGRLRELDEQERRLADFADVMEMLPVKQLLYHAVESAFPVMLSWEPRANAAEDARVDGHVVTVVGHVFDPHAWLPEAELDYFRLRRLDAGSEAGYLRSSSWSRDFIVMDDNLGPYYSLFPDALRRHDGIVRVLTVVPKDVTYLPELIETAAAADLGDVCVPQLKDDWGFPMSDWGARLALALERKRPILRTVWAHRSAYIAQMEAKCEGVDTYSIGLLEKHLPKDFWLVEVSVPELYTANKSKVADLFYPSTWPEETVPQVHAYRFPGHFSFTNADGTVTSHRSTLTEHYPLYRPRR